MKEPKFKVGDEVYRPSDIRRGDIFYNKQHPNIFIIVKVNFSSREYCYFGKSGFGTFESDLRLLTKLDKVLK